MDCHKYRMSHTESSLQNGIIINYYQLQTDGTAHGRICLSQFLAFNPVPHHGCE